MSDTLAAAIAELAASSIGSCAASAAAFDATTQDQLARQDEIAALIESVRNDITRNTDVAFPAVLAQARVRLRSTERLSLVCRDGQQRREAFFYPSRPFSKLCRPQELKALYAVIDAMEQAVNAAADATATAASRLDVLTAASAEGSAPNGLAKVARFFTRGAGSNASRVADAPVTLPPYTPAELDVDALLGSLAAAVGDAAELAAARGHLRGPLPPFEEAEGETGGDVDEGTAETEVAAGGGAAKEAVYGGGADDL